MGYLQSIMGSDESVVFATRRHWTAIAGTIIVTTILALIIVVVAVMLLRPTQGLSLLLLLLLIVPLGRLAVAYLNWWNEQYIITNRRIVQIEGVFNKHVIDSSLEKVNDVVMGQSFLGRLLGYGDIEILTASDIGVNKLEKISNPIRFKTTMLDQKSALEDSGGSRAAPRTMTELLEELVSLRDRGLLTEEEFQAEKKELLARM